VLLHVVIVAALLEVWPVHRALLAKAPMIMTFIVAPVAEHPREPPRPLPMAPTPKPRTVPTRAIDPPPVIAVATDSPSPITLPATDSVKAPAPDSAIAASASASVPSPAAAPAITPPSFNAAYLDNPAPPYPAIARRTGEQGRVLLRVLVSTAGTAESVEVRTTSGSPRLDHAAQETVRHWRFVPARQGDRAVAAWVLVPISFTLST
jgi:protein TonB